MLSSHDLAHYEELLAEYGYQFGEWFYAKQNPETEEEILRSYPVLLEAADQYNKVSFSKFDYKETGDFRGITNHAWMTQQLFYVGYPVADISLYIVPGSSPDIHFSPLQKANAVEWQKNFMPEYAGDKKYGTMRELFLTELLKGISTLNAEDNLIRLRSDLDAFKLEKNSSNNDELDKKIINRERRIAELTEIGTLSTLEEFMQNKRMNNSFSPLHLNIVGNNFEAARGEKEWNLSLEDIDLFTQNRNTLIRTCIQYHDMFQDYAFAGHTNKFF
jgi:hypothetical protein